MKKSEKILEELRKIARKNRGLLKVESVVDAARNPKSALHSQFQWDNAAAAQEYRAWQARELIAQYWVVESVSLKPIRLLLSLVSDRRDGGYRDSADVLADPAQRGEWLQMAFGELRRVQKSYGALDELAPVWVALERAARRYAISPAEDRKLLAAG